MAGVFSLSYLSPQHSWDLIPNSASSLLPLESLQSLPSLLSITPPPFPGGYSCAPFPLSPTILAIHSLLPTFGVPLIKNIFMLSLHFPDRVVRFGAYGYTLENQDFTSRAGPVMGYTWSGVMKVWLTRAQITIGIGPLRRSFSNLSSLFRRRTTQALISDLLSLCS